MARDRAAMAALGVLAVLAVLWLSSGGDSATAPAAASLTDAESASASSGSGPLGAVVASGFKSSGDAWQSGATLLQGAALDCAQWAGDGDGDSGTASHPHLMGGMHDVALDDATTAQVLGDVWPAFSTRTAHYARSRTQARASRTQARTRAAAPASVRVLRVKQQVVAGMKRQVLVEVDSGAEARRWIVEYTRLLQSQCADKGTCIRDVVLHQCT